MFFNKKNRNNLFILDRDDGLCNFFDGSQKSVLILGSTRSGKTYRLKELLISKMSAVIFPSYHKEELNSLKQLDIDLFVHNEIHNLDEDSKALSFIEQSIARVEERRLTLN